MSKGEEHVVAALATCQSMSAQAAALNGLDANWASDMSERLSTVSEMLQQVQGRFFLRSKLCLPFARRCSTEAERLQGELAALDSGDDANDQAVARALEALGTLERAVRTLDERSEMKGMAIT